MDLYTAIVAGVMLLSIPLFIWTFKPEIDKRRGKHLTEEDKRQHAQDLQKQVYQRLLDIRLQEQSGKLVLSIPKEDITLKKEKNYDWLIQGIRGDIPYIPVTELEYLDWALDHLKKYPDIFNHWFNIEWHIDFYNQFKYDDNSDWKHVRKSIGIQMDFFVSKLRKQIVRKKHAFVLEGKCGGCPK